MRRLSFGSLLFMFFISIFTISCTSKVKTDQKQLELKLGFNALAKFSGNFYNNSDKSHYYYFADPITAKKISIFDLDFNPVSTINLEDFLKSQTDINDIVPISLDSILILKNYTNELFLLNQKGELVNYLSLNNYIKSKNKYELYSSSFSGFLDFNNPNHLIFAQNWSIENDEPYQSDYENLSFFYNKNNEIPKFLEIKNLFKTGKKPTINEHLDHFFSTFIPKNSFSFEFNFYSLYGDTLIFSSWYSDHIFIYNMKTKKMIKSIGVTSKYTKIGAKNLIITENNEKTISDEVDQNLNKSGLIKRFLYDQHSKKLFVFIDHEIEKPGKEPVTVYNQSMLVFDENFNQLDEIFLDGKKYNTRLVLTGRKNELLIESRNNNERLSKTKVFTCFQFDFD